MLNIVLYLYALNWNRNLYNRLPFILMPKFLYLFLLKKIKELDTSCSNSSNNVATLTIENATNQH